jgi:arylsulfatase B
VQCGQPGVPAKKLGAYDLWNQSTAHFPGAPVHSLATNDTMDDRTYSGYVFTRRAVEVVRQHDASAGPLFMYLALHNTHAPLEAPQRFLNMYSHFANDTRKQTLSAMVSVVDESVANLTAALKAQPGMWENTLLVWTTDNGSPVNAGGSNYPLRGGKGSNWEGGIRVPTFVAGGVLPASMAGKHLDGLVSVADWWATFAGLAGLAPTAPAAGPAAPQSIDQWPYLSGVATAPPRTELVHDHHMFTNASALNGTCAGQKPFSLPGYSALGALRQGDWKLLVGVEFQASWYGKFTPNITGKVPADYEQVEACRDAPCLFNVRLDPTEHSDVAGANPDRVAQMVARFKELEAAYHPPLFPPAPQEDRFCAAVSQHGGFVAPFMPESDIQY